MATINAGDVPINENQVDGTELARRLERLYAAFHSQNSSASRPPAITPGALWAQTVGGSFDIMMFDGTNDIKIGGSTGNAGPQGPAGADGAPGPQGPAGPGANQELNTYNSVTFAAVTSTGEVTAFSDERLKVNWQDLPNDLVDQLATLLAGTYERVDTNEIQIGVGAQSLQKFMPQAVKENAEGILSVAYGNAALAACVALAKRVVALEEKLNGNS